MPARYRENGFTLLEIVVVLVVVATLATLAVLSIGNVGQDEKLRRAAQRLVSAVDLAAEEAALSGYPIGLEIKSGSIEFQVYQAGEWQVLERGRLFAPYEFYEGLDVMFDTSNDSGVFDEESTQPTIVLLPDGERWLRSIALVDSETNATLTLMPNLGSYQIQVALP